MTKPNLTMDRRTLLSTFGLSAGSLFLPSLIGDKQAYAQGGAQKRFFVYYTPHGPVQQNYTMRANGPGGWNGGTKSDRDKAYDFKLPDVEANWSAILKPLFPFRQKMIALEGLAMTSALADVSTNNHNAGTSHALTGAKMLYPGGFSREGGGGDTSVDQLIADKIADPMRLKSLYYTSGGWSPIFRGQAEQSGLGNLARAYDKLFPVSSTGDKTTDLIKKRRQKALAMLSSEYKKVTAQVSGDDRKKIENHWQTMSELEQQIGFRSTAGAMCAARPAMNPGATATDHAKTFDAWGKIIAAALSCDMSRVAVMTNGGLSSQDAVSLLDVHTDLHLDIAHNATPQNTEAFTKMTNYYKLLASDFASILKSFDAVTVDGGKTLLDQTVCVWLCELACGPHDLHDIMAVVVGGGGFTTFNMGRYIKYPEINPNPRNGTQVGPAHNKLLVSLMQAFGMTNTTIGMTKASTGGKFDLDGPLPLLKA
ncbi:MAG: DUF1552 domain-containing protein [Deltaproteobacteria bacterium]|nr:DUF1552 domain-containing protein [Deltaproteobacteria bacterium]